MTYPKITDILIWIGSIACLISSIWIGLIVYLFVDEWEGHIQGALLPFVIAILATFPFLMALGYLYGRFVINRWGRP